MRHLTPNETARKILSYKEDAGTIVRQAISVRLGRTGEFSVGGDSIDRKVAGQIVKLGGLAALNGENNQVYRKSLAEDLKLVGLKLQGISNGSLKERNLSETIH